MINVLLLLQIIFICLSFYSFPEWGGTATGDIGLYSLLIKGSVLAIPFSCLSLLVLCGLPLSRDCLRKLMQKNRGFLLLALYGVLSSVWSPMLGMSFARGIAFLITVISICSLVIMYSYFNNEKAWDIILFHIQISFFIAHCVILYLAILRPDLAFQYTISRLGGALIHSNTLGAFAMISILINSYLLICEKKRCLLSFSTAVMALTILIMTYSRTSIIVTIICFNLMLFLYSKNLTISKKSMMLMRSLVILVNVSIFLLINDNLSWIINVFSRGDSFESMMTATSRTLLWRIILDHLDS